MEGLWVVLNFIITMFDVVTAQFHEGECSIVIDDKLRSRFDSMICILNVEVAH